MIYSQLDVPNTLAIVMKAISVYTPKEGAIEIPSQHFQDLCLCVEVISIFVSGNTDQIWSMLNTAKVVPSITNLYRLCSLMDSARLKTSAASTPAFGSAHRVASYTHVDEFQSKWEHLSDLLMNTLKSSLKKDNPTNNTNIFNTLFGVVLKPITVLETTCGCWKKKYAFLRCFI